MVDFLRIARLCVGETNLYITMEMMPFTLWCGHFLIYREVRDIPTLQPQTTIRRLTPLCVYTQSVRNNHVIVLRAVKYYHINGKNQIFCQRVWSVHISLFVDVGEPLLYAL